MFEIKKNPFAATQNLVVSFDLEWTKNYKIKNGNQPFCFSFVFFPLNTNISKLKEGLEFGILLKYVESKNEIKSLIEEADVILGHFLHHPGKVKVIGHQISSDISVILNYPSKAILPNFTHLKYLWKSRKEALVANKDIAVFDTRYDMGTLLEEGSRRLVDVCQECGLIVTQPEIATSMTKMQNDYYTSRDIAIRERISVLNIRHSLSAAILFLLHQEGEKLETPLNTNQLLYRNLAQQFQYINSKDFAHLL